jgi:hypothetical protein
MKRSNGHLWFVLEPFKFAYKVLVLILKILCRSEGTFFATNTCTALGSA